MDPDAVAAVERVPHGGHADPAVLDYSANTNPERPPGTKAVYERAFAAARRYPDDDYADFRAAAGDVVGCAPDTIVPLPGAMAALRLALEVTLAPGDRALLPAPSFGEYAREVRLQGATPTFVPHDRILDVGGEDRPGGGADVDLAAHALAVVCTPNNPTGEAADPGTLRAFAARCREAGTTLVVDEAFLDFTDRPSLAGEPGAVVVRSLTKMYGLPGLRAGYAAATGDLRARLAAAAPPWALSTPAAAVGAHCLRQSAFAARTRARVASERARLADALGPHFEVFPSDAPFLLLGVDDADPVLETARERGVVLRDARTFRGLDSHVRVAIKRPRENDRLLAALGVR